MREKWSLEHYTSAPTNDGLLEKIIICFFLALLSFLLFREDLHKQD